MKLFQALLCPLCTLAIVWSLAGCGGNGSDSLVVTPQAEKTGSVAVLLADGPTDAYDEINITITEVSLIPDCDDEFWQERDKEGHATDRPEPGRSHRLKDGGGDDDDGDHDGDDDDHDCNDGKPVVIFSSEEGVIVNLLDLRDEDYLLTVKDDVPAGSYSKIRMRVSKVETVGGPCDDLEVKLPSGKIDLNPRGSFEVIPDQVLSIRLDVDVDKSILLKPAGSSGKCIFRPVVFVDIMEGSPPDRCPRLITGTIEELITEGEDEEVTTVGFRLGLEGDGDLEVYLRDDVVIFDEEGLPADAGAIAEGQLARVRGRLDDEGRLQARVVILGPIVTVRGLVETAVEDGMFALLVDGGESEGEDKTVELTDSTFVLIGCDTLVDPSAIQPGLEALVAGKELEDGKIRAVAVLLDSGRICGELTEVLPRASGGHDLVIVPEETDEEVAELRVAHLAPDAPAVDVYVDEELVLEDVAYPAVSEYLEVEPGERTVAITGANAPDPVLLATDVSLAAGSSSTVAVTGLVASEDLQFLVLEDDRETDPENAKVRLVHASPDAPAVDVAVVEGAVIFSNVAFRTATPYQTLPAGTFDLVVREAGTENVLLSIDGVTLEAGTNTTVFAIGLVGGSSLDVVSTSDGRDGESEDDGPAPRMVFLPEGTPVRLVGDGEVPIRLLAELVSCASRGVCVMLEADGLARATKLLVDAETLEGTVGDTDGIPEALVVDEKPVRLAENVTAIDLATSDLIPLEAIEVGDQVIVHGLEACPGADVAFYGAVVLRLPESLP